MSRTPLTTACRCRPPRSQRNHTEPAYRLGADREGPEGHSIVEHCFADKNAECLGERALSKMVASTIAALFGLANLFARGMGGMVSDSLFRMLGFLGRMWAPMM